MDFQRHFCSSEEWTLTGVGLQSTFRGIAVTVAKAEKGHNFTESALSFITCSACIKDSLFVYLLYKIVACLSLFCLVG